VVWLASELMFFSGLFAAYFTLRAASTGPWPPVGVDLSVLVSGLFTLVLVVSSGTMQLAVANQAREWATLDFRIDSHAFGSAFYLMTGFHGLHVIGGLAAMLVLLLRANDRRFDAGETPSVEVVSYYWHFVDVVWVGLWATLFVLR